MFLFNLKIALRNIWTSKVFSGINIIGLSLGISCCFVILLYVWNEWQHDRFHKNAAQIFRVTEKQNQAGTLYNVAVTPGPLAPALQKDFPEVISTVRFGNWSGLLKADGQTLEQKAIQLTDNAIFKVFGFPLVQGNAATALLAPDDIVITEAAAEKYFGAGWRSKASLLGKTFRLNDQTNFKLAGIAKNPPVNSSIQFDILLPLDYLFQSDKWSYKWNSNSYHTYLQLAPGTDVAAFGKKIERQLSQYNDGSEDLLVLQPMLHQYLRSAFDFNTDWGKRSNIKYLKIFGSVGILLLIIACVNFINLSTARSLKRAMEVGVRKVNGATRAQLVFQFLSESLLMAFIAGVLALVIIAATQPLVQTLAGTAFAVSPSEAILLPFFFLFVVLIGLLAGLYPAFVLSSFKPAAVLKKSDIVHSGKLFRQALVVVQFTISVTLMVCTFFMYRQFQFIRQKNLGFDQEQVVNVRLGGSLGGAWQPFKTDLEALNGITAVAPATMSLVSVDNSTYMEWEGMQPEDKFLITQANIDPAFIPALGMKLIAGNNFSRQLTNDTANYIVNETAVKRMGYTVENAIGRKVEFWGAKGNIIGVVKDFHFKPLSAGIEPFIFRYQPKDRYFSLFIKTAAGRSQQVLQQVEKIYKKYEAEAPFEFQFLADAINQSYLYEQRTATIILLFAGLTIFVGCLGLFGLAVYTAERRMKEIGIRKVLGATLASITTMFTSDFLKLVWLAILIATPAAWFITQKWLQNYAYRIPVEWWVFALVALGVTVIALLTVSIQAVKAAMANPVKSLRTE